MTASADPGKAGHRRRGSFARIAHDPGAFASFYREHVTAVTRFVARRVADPHTVADLTAEVFLAVIGSAHTYRPGRGTQVAWLYGIARNVIAGERRRAAHELRTASRIAGRRLLDDDDIARLEERIDAESPGRAACQALAGLPPDERAVLELVAIDGLQVKDAATALGIRQGAHRGLDLTTASNGEKYPSEEYWCMGGYVQPPSIINGARQRCTARDFAGYQPWLPTTTAGMLAYLEKTDGVFHRPKLLYRRNYAENLLNDGFYLLMNYDLTPAQQAAAYHALAQIPKLTIVPKVTDLLGRAGVGIRSHFGPGDTWTAIFDPTTFKPLGSIVKTRLGNDDLQAIAVQATIVNKVGQRP